MKRKRLFICLFSLFFLVFFAGAANEIWDRHTVSKNDFIQLAGGDPFDDFSKEILTVLAETLPDQQTFDAVCKAASLREDVYHDEILIILYLEDNSGKDIIVWSMEKRKMRTSKAIREFAQDAVHSLLRRLGRDLPTVITPVVAPAAKRIVL
ncbi:hypothetical protein KJ590_00240 [Patescibacteria group bacterium]|nr:hypothetical protein [Patescibacteria group bacterium]